jgi:acyl dehydratase
VQRAKTEMPGGKTIAHGYLVLCVMSQMRIFTIEHYSKALNYGLDRLRFTGAVPSGSRIRLKQTLKALERVNAGYRLVITCVVEVENQERPSLVADQVLQYFDPK